MALAASYSVVIDDSSARAALDGVMRRTGPDSLAAFMTAIAAPYFSRKADERFRTSSGGDWPALQEVTHDIRESLGFTRGENVGEINVRTGMLRNWATQPKISIAHDGIGTTMKWPGDEPTSAEMKHRLAQAAGKRKGEARFVIQYDISDVAHLVSAMTGFVMGADR